MANSTNISKSIEKWALASTQKMQSDLFSGIKADTPVKTGRARDGWENAPVSKLGATGIINNDVEYIGWLEFGSDTVAPSAMVRNNLKKVGK